MHLVHMLTKDESIGSLVPSSFARIYLAWHTYRGTIDPKYVDMYTRPERIADAKYYTMRTIS